MKPFVRLAALMLVAIFVAGCDDEPAQRKAFIEFLQTRIIDKPGFHVPILSEEDGKKFGPYAKHYAVIADFNSGLDRAVTTPMQGVMQRGSIHSLDEVMTRHADIVALRDGMGELRGALDKQLAAADAAHAALKQPDDLKPVFDKAYEKDVTVPAQAFADIFPDLSQALTAIADLGDFLEQHKDKIKITGLLIQTTDPTLQPELAAHVNALSAKTAAINKAQQRLRAILQGS